MKIFTGEVDKEEIPETEKILDWWLFNTDMYSSDREYSEVKEICERFGSKKVDLRPYMIEQPYVVHTCDSLPKALELFRHMHLRALPVIDPNDGTPVGIITRQDLFSYMSL
jgi:CBS domain-containing protein